MRKDNTWTGDHHWIPKRGKWAKANPRLWEAAYSDCTTYLEHEEHVQVQNETKTYGSIGALSRLERRRLEEQFGDDSSEYEDNDDEDY